jgi:hypothetical protein
MNKGGWPRRAVAGGLICAATLIAAGVAWASYDGSATVTHFNGNIVSCTDLGYTADGTFASNGASGTYNHDHANGVSSLNVEVTNHGGNPETFDWHATGGSTVAAVIVKVGNGGTVYTYPHAASSDTGLESQDSTGHPKDSISHLVFCIGRPTAVTLRSFAAARTPAGVVLKWKTGSEAGTLGFNIYRKVGKAKVKVNKALIAGSSRATGSAYSLVDRKGPHGRAVHYLLQEVEQSGARNWVAQTSVSR